MMTSVFSASAQLTKERIASDSGLANGVHHSYSPQDLRDTPAPKGYKPFYISHVGRHGSRYDLGDGYAYQEASRVLHKADSAGILTAQGMDVMRQVDLMNDASDGMWEMLTQRGAREHRGIASRMMSRFPQVFSMKERDEVDAVSSTVQRCVLSMSNFLLQVGGQKPGMKITMDTGSRYMRYLMVWDSRGRSQQKTVRPDSKKWLQENLDPSRLMSVLFTDPVKAASFSDPYDICENLYDCSSYTETMDLESVVNIQSIFSLDELWALACNESDVFYAENGPSLLYGEVTGQQGRAMLRDIVAKADAALSAGSKRAADLRFTHDTALLPLATLMGFSGMDIRLPQLQAHEQWCSGDMIPMGSNLQVVFYRSRKSQDVLVKVLYNEKERTFRGLTAVEGPYYRWNELREYLLGKC